MDKIQFKKLLAERILITDGSMGALLQQKELLKPGMCPEELNLTAPEKITEIHRDYLDAGSDMVLTNTLEANELKLEEFGLKDRLEEINKKAVENARNAAVKYDALVAGDVGSLGTYITPLGPLTFDNAYSLYSRQIKALAGAGCDLIFIETIMEIKELKAAVLAARDNFSGPVIANMTFNSDGSTVTGTDILAFLATIEGMGVDAIGVNCSVGPEELVKLVKILCENTSLPVSFKPNAGMPKLINRKTVFPGTPEEFAKAGKLAFSYGTNFIGGCCGTNPEFIRALSAKIKGKPPVKRKTAERFFLSSRT